MRNNVQSDLLPYTLSSCLVGEAKKLVENVSDNLTEMWKRLDVRYGDITTLVDTLLYDLLSTKPITGVSDDHFSEFVDVIERAHIEFKRTGQQEGLYNNSMITEIENKLPREIRNKWSTIVIDEDLLCGSEGKFVRLLGFLQLMKISFEYMSAKIRNRSKHKSDSPEHDTDFRSVERKNKLRKRILQRRCWIHKTDDHQISDCTDFLSMSQEDKWKLMKDNQGCYACLKQGHKSSACYNSTECNSDGCSQIHHPTLHRLS